LTGGRVVRDEGGIMRTSLGWAAVLLATSALAADWTPRRYADADTIELRTVEAGKGEHWFPVWIVVIDDHVYVRLGSRAAGRVERNEAKPYLGVRILGDEFARVRGEPAPEQGARVADAIAEKYWSDKLLRFFSHPLTLRLVPEGQ
jgi:hypothetical protein